MSNILSRLLKRTMVALGAGAVAALAASPGAAADYEWRIQSNLNASHPGFVTLKEGFAERVETMSGGRMKFTVFPVDQLFPTSEGLEAVSSGIVDMAVLTGGYYSGKIGHVANLETGVPGSLTTPIERFGLFYHTDFMDVVRKVYGRHGVYYLGPNISGSWDIVSTVPIKSMEDFNGLKIRAFGIEAEWYKKMGAIPIFLSGAELYTAMATGQVDAVRWGSPAMNESVSLQEVSKYYVQPSPMPVPNNFFAVNQAKWDSLPDDLKSILTEAAKLSTLDYLIKTHEEDAKALKDMLASGMEMSVIPPEEWEKIEAVARGLWEDYANDGGETAEAVKILQDYMAVVH